MNLKEIVEWAEKIDISLVEEKRRERAKCYKDMIIERSHAINELTAKTENYMGKIQDFIFQLDRIGIKFEKHFEPEPIKEEPKVVETVATPEKPRIQSPLLPKEELVDKSLQEGTEVSTESKKIL